MPLRRRASWSNPPATERATFPNAANHDAPLHAPSAAHTARASHSPNTRNRTASSRSASACTSTTSSANAASSNPPGSRFHDSHITTSTSLD